MKGAPEVIAAHAARFVGPDHESWSGKADAYAREGFRVLALAWAPGEVDESWSLLGLVLLWDPPRAEVPGAVAAGAGRGGSRRDDHGRPPGHGAGGCASDRHLPGVARADRRGSRALTSRARSAAALDEVNVFARVPPEQKLQLVEALQDRRQIVAMTGDGVNDAPALKRSDVGVAMGQRGSDVSREVADLVLLDDNFATIVGAIEEGRGIYENIQKFLRFLFSTNLSEVLLVAGGAVLAFGLDLRDSGGALLLPLTAAQILWINLVTDGLPALALAFDRTPGVMQQPPRPPESRAARSPRRFNSSSAPAR